MNSSMMLVDYWEEFNQKRVEFRKMMKDIIRDAFLDGNGRFEIDDDLIAETYAEEKIKELF